MDIGYFMVDQVIVCEVFDFFNSLIGYWCDEEYDYLFVVFGSMCDQFLVWIEWEIEVYQCSGDGQLVFKMNVFVDCVCIDVFY